MKNKILVIFLFSTFFCLLIYKLFSFESKKILILGDNFLLNDKNSYINYLYDDIGYENINTYFTFSNKKYIDIINDIKNNYYIYYKNDKLYLNQLISKSDYIIFNASNDIYFDKCNKSDDIYNQYNKKLETDIYTLTTLIKKFSKAKLIIIGNYCDSKNQYVLENKLYKFISIDNSDHYNKKLTKIGNYKLYKNILNKL